MKVTGRMYALGRGVEKDSPIRYAASTTMYSDLAEFDVILIAMYM